LLNPPAKTPAAGEGGMSRSAQYLRYLVAHMEQLRMIKIYRWAKERAVVVWRAWPAQQD
jgi:hypothetical protein